MSRFTKLMGIMIVVFIFTTVTGVKAYHTNRARIEAQRTERLRQQRQLPKSKSSNSLAHDEQTPVAPKKKSPKKEMSKDKNSDSETSAQSVQDSNASSYSN